MSTLAILGGEPLRSESYPEWPVFDERDVEVVTAYQYFGPIVSDLNARKAVVRDTRIRGGDRVISADVPLSQMFGYITKLRSLSQGRATSTMAPSHYAPVPAEEMRGLVG